MESKRHAAKERNILVTQPSMPTFEDFVPDLKRIWDTKILSNIGPFHLEFEKRIAERLGAEEAVLFANGTIALVASLRVLEVKGEVMTTPFSFAATAHAIAEAGAHPVFVDIEEDGFNIDPERISEAINEETAAILPVHCYGLPCRTEEIARIATEHGIPVVYDAAHAFGVECHCGSLFQHGDMSAVSFHATKPFHTFEGGAVLTSDAQLARELRKYRNFGYTSEAEIDRIGINGKLSEFSCAFGILQLKSFEHYIAKRKVIANIYDDMLSASPYLRLGISAERYGRVHNYSYYPILVNGAMGCSRDDVNMYLQGQGIFARRYFWPLLSSIGPYRDLESTRRAELPRAEKVAREVLCLPIHSNMAESDAEYVANSVLQSLSPT